MKYFSVILLATILSGCMASNMMPVKPQQAEIEKNTRTGKMLQSLPSPVEKIIVAVYKFRDQTGQYKQTETGSSWSTAVTQGATSILLNSLEDSGWFTPIEREGLSDLLNERKIIRSSRANYEGVNGSQGDLLPPLLFAGVLIEGGIISYETNIKTGGVGIKYFGAGGSNQYREDKVSIYLRIISTQNGRILKTVNTSKTILSQMVDVGFYRFVDFKRLMEVETGYSYNEPVDMAVREAIEKAVYSLIMEGMIDELWASSDPAKAYELLREYKQEKQLALDSDYLENNLNLERSAGMRIDAGGQLFSGDYPDGAIDIISGVSLLVPLSYSVSLSLNANYAEFGNDHYYTTQSGFGLANLIYNMAPDRSINPFLSVGGGMIYYDQNNKTNAKLSSSGWDGIFSIGLGAEVFVSNKVAVSMSFNNWLTLTDKIDGISNGKWYDNFYSSGLGIVFYPGR